MVDAGTVICPCCVLATGWSQGRFVLDSRFPPAQRCTPGSLGAAPPHLPVVQSSCVFGCEHWMCWLGALAYVTQALGKETEPEAASTYTSKPIWPCLGWPRPILSPCGRGTESGGPDRTSSEIKPLNRLQRGGTSCFGPLTHSYHAELLPNFSWEADLSCPALLSYASPPSKPLVRFTGVRYH